MVSSMIHCSIVARRVDVPANGSNENAIFPNGHETSFVIGGVGATSRSPPRDSANAGNEGISVVDRAPATTSCCSTFLRSGDEALSLSLVEGIFGDVGDDGFENASTLGGEPRMQDAI